MVMFVFPDFNACLINLNSVRCYLKKRFRSHFYLFFHKTLLWRGALDAGEILKHVTMLYFSILFEGYITGYEGMLIAESESDVKTDAA